MKTPGKIVKTRYIVGKASVGFMTPQLQIQITPTLWGAEFAYVSTNKVPEKVAFRLGPIAISLYFGPAEFVCSRSYSNSTSSYFKAAKQPKVK